MKFVKNNLGIFLCSLFLLLLAVCISKIDQPAESQSLPFFYVQSSSDSNTEKVSIFDAGDGNYYVFLPSYTTLDHVTIFLPDKKEMSIDNVTLHDGMGCGHYELAKPYAFSVCGEQTGTIWFYQSENVAAMYIDTASGSMEAIHRDKNYEENVSMTLYAADGSIDYSDGMSTLKGRGNSTWTYEKRPYSLTLSSDGNLLNMGDATNWILLANAYDETNLRNKLVLDMATRVGLEGTPESRWVELYLNSEYNGLYLLTEKVEAHENRLNIDTTNDFLCKVDLNERWDLLQNSLLSEGGRAVEITSPQKLGNSDLDRIRQLINQMENAILSNEDLCESRIIDLDSWVRRYLIDEITGNIDSDLASSYFYYSDGRFFAGPCWDYDKTFGNYRRNQEPCAFVAKNLYKSSTYLSPYYDSLYTNDSFYSRMTELYLKEFKPIIQHMLEHEIDCMVEHIKEASQSNSLRWRKMFISVQNEEPNTVHTSTGIKEYLARRIGFLDSAWLNNTQYCTVQFECSFGDEYWNASVKQGSCFETTYLDIVSTTWYDKATGEVVDFTQPIMSDAVFTKYPADPVPAMPLYVTRDYITFLSIAVLIILLAGFMIADIIYRRQERR